MTNKQHCPHIVLVDCCLLLCWLYHPFLSNVVYLLIIKKCSHVIIRSHGACRRRSWWPRQYQIYHPHTGATIAESRSFECRVTMLSPLPWSFIPSNWLLHCGVMGLSSAFHWWSVNFLWKSEGIPSSPHPHLIWLLHHEHQYLLSRAGCG